MSEDIAAELLAIVKDTRAFNRGEGKYNFSQLSDIARANASDDAWYEIAERMDAVLAKATP